jgi:hypothetical protein
MANTRSDQHGGAGHRGSTRKARLAPKGHLTRKRSPGGQSQIRRLLMPLGLVGVVVAVVAGLVVTSLTAGGTSVSEGSAPSTVVNQVTRLPSSVLIRVGDSPQAPTIHRVPNGPGLTVDGKPGVVFVSEESCPFCAAERWPVVIALSHFGTWRHLGSTASSSTDIYPSTATFSFRDATFTSPSLAVRTTELTNDAGQPLQTATPLDTALISRYDVPPYVNAADQSGSVPFLDIDNHYILAGAQYDPQVLAGLSMSQIASQLDDPASPVAMAIDESANALIAAIDQVLSLPAGRG